MKLKKYIFFLFHGPICHIQLKKFKRFVIVTKFFVFLLKTKILNFSIFQGRTYYTQ